MKMIKSFVPRVMVTFIFFMCINAQQAPRARNLMEFYNTGVSKFTHGEVDEAMKIFHEVSKAPSATMEDYQARIGALQNLIFLIREQRERTNKDTEIDKYMQMKEQELAYSASLVKRLHEAFQLACMSADPEDKLFKQRLAKTLLDILKGKGNYKFGGKEQAIMWDDSIKRYLENNKQAYLTVLGEQSTIGEQAQKELQTIRLNDALTIVQEAVAAFDKAMLSHESFRPAFDLFLQASGMRNDIPNVEYHLGLMYLRGMGTHPDIKLALHHLELALKDKKIVPVDLLIKIEALKKEADARLLMDKGFLKYRQSLNKELLTLKERAELRKEAFMDLQNANQLYPNLFDVEIALAQMFLKGDGTAPSFTQAKTHAKLAKNIARAGKDALKETYVQTLIDEIDAAAMTAATAPKGTDYNTERALSRVFGKRASAAPSITDKDEDEETKWFNVLFGSAKPRARQVSANEPVPLTEFSNMSFGGVESSASLNEASAAPSEGGESSSLATRRSNAGFGASLFGGGKRK